MPADPVFSPAGDKLTGVPYLGSALLAQRHGQKALSLPVLCVVTVNTPPEAANAGSVIVANSPRKAA